MTYSAAEIIRLLDLQPPTTCGYVSEPYRSSLKIPETVHPTGYVGSRALGNVLYFLVTPAAGVRLHRIRSNQVYHHHYRGGALEVLLLYADGRSQVKLVGTDLAAGERPQFFIPDGTFHTARVVAHCDYALLGTSVFLSAESTDVEMSGAVKLAAAHPTARSLRKAFTSSAD